MKKYVSFGKIHSAMSFACCLQSEHVPTSGQLSKRRLVAIAHGTVSCSRLCILTERLHWNLNYENDLITS